MQKDQIDVKEATENVTSENKLPKKISMLLRENGDEQADDTTSTKKKNRKRKKKTPAGGTEEQTLENSEVT